MKNDSDDEHRYDDIIDLPRHRSQKHPHMPLADRAAQFSPFAALTGHGDAVKETARLTEDKIELNEEEKAYLNARILFLTENIKEHPEVSITFYVPDERKEGGAYSIKIGTVKRVDEYEQAIVMEDGIVIPVDGIVAMDSGAFERMETDQ